MPSSDRILEFIRVMWSVDHELHRVSKRMVERIGLTAPQRLAVRFIGLHPDVTLGGLARLLHLHPGTVTGIVHHLETERLVGRTRGEEDTRQYYLRLTAKGRQVNLRHKGTVEAAVRRTAAALSPAKMATAAAVMTALARCLAEE